ncbi:glycosyltransferase family 71 protein [Sporormia fimetaria CBS 119925]|uniref:Glycosyltransferase family 71 protein n=1 Tax=Sporormia fimetaria CBS 119925 TaxID=1340428 RepID=A0A6A6UYZ7_9PLEO|nr:glycosyltransferase family 71 protein [Sporormia fimetaria CBS 119925]
MMLVRHLPLGSRTVTFLLAFSVFLTFCFLAPIQWPGPRSHSFATSDSHVDATPYGPGYPPELISFWKDLAKAFEDARPQCPEINVTKGEMSDHDKNWEPLVEKKRPDRITLPEADELELTRKHRQMRLAARRLAPSYPIGKGRGIVTTGGLKLVPVLMVSLRMLRRTGSTLPVEVFLGDKDEYNQVAETCEKVLPTLNARCRIISEIYNEAIVSAPDHFQFKVLAILFSSFQHVLFLDADAFPVHNPDSLLTSAPYTTHALLTWPGFYANAASPHYYHIASLPSPPVNRGTESGILLLNKAVHRESLLLMTYYNYYGPKYYYPLQAQGGPGQGDKETFGAAALAVHAPLYRIRSPVLMLGAHVNGKFVFAGAAQVDPVQDYAYDAPAPSHLFPKYEWVESDAIGAKDEENRKPRAFFVHTVSQGTKLDPGKLLRKGGLAYMENNEEWHRVWGPQEWGVEKFGYDVERVMWECVEEEGCRMDRETCALVKRFRKRVFG